MFRSTPQNTLKSGGFLWLLLAFPNWLSWILTEIVKSISGQQYPRLTFCYNIE